MCSKRTLEALWKMLLIEYKDEAMIETIKENIKETCAATCNMLMNFIQMHVNPWNPKS